MPSPPLAPGSVLSSYPGTRALPREPCEAGCTAPSTAQQQGRRSENFLTVSLYVRGRRRPPQFSTVSPPSPMATRNQRLAFSTVSILFLIQLKWRKLSNVVVINPRPSPMYGRIISKPTSHSALPAASLPRGLTRAAGPSPSLRRGPARWEIV